MEKVRVGVTGFPEEHTIQPPIPSNTVIEHLEEVYGLGCLYDADGDLVLEMLLEGGSYTYTPDQTRHLPPQLGIVPFTYVDWEKAFFQETERNSSAYLLAKLDTYAVEWDGGLKWQAPFTAVVQSSGWGKSYTICQLRKHGVYVVYCSFMKPEYTGYPRRSVQARCFDGQMSWALVCAYLVASFDVLADTHYTPEEWLECQIRGSQNVVGEAIASRHFELLREMANLKYENRSEEFRALLKQLRQAVTSLEEKQSHSLRRDGALQVLFAFDEGRGLKDFSKAFPVFCQALGCLPMNKGLFVVFADTNASVSNFAPQKRIDPYREHGQVFDPIHLIGQADVSVETDKLDVSLRHLFVCGRPLWHAHFVNSCADEDQKLADLVAFAAWKLRSGNRSTTMSKVDAAAVFMACIGPEILSRSYLAQDLVAGHMATCVGTAEGRQRLIMVHPSEAVLGEAAAIILHHQGFLVPALHFLAELLTEGLVLEGVRGELVARILMLLCMHKCAHKAGSPYYTGAVTLREFLETMYGPQWLADQCQVGYLDAEVCFNHFVPLCSGIELSRDRVRAFIAHGAAVFYPRNERMTDMAIPWAMRDSHGMVKDVGTLEVQVRNRKKFRDGDARAKLKHQHQKHRPYQSPVPILIMKVGHLYEHVEQDDKSTSTVSHGLSNEVYPFLETGVVGALGRILAVETGFTSMVPKHELEFVKRIAVLSL